MSPPASDERARAATPAAGCAAADAAAASGFGAFDDPDELEQVARRVDADGPRRELLAVIDGVHCAACSLKIEAALGSLADTVEVNVASRRARIVWDADAVPLSALLARIERQGYGPRPIPLDAIAAIDTRHRRAALWRMLVALFCAMQIMMYAYPRYVAADALPADMRRLLLWAEVVLTAPVVVFACGPFFAGAWRDLRAGVAGMDLPVALGIAVALASSVAGSLNGQDVWFDSVTMFVALLSVARWLDGRARERAAGGLASAVARLPRLVRRRRDDGGIDEVSRRRLVPGDRIEVAAGDVIPVDARIVDGLTQVDESMLTGESTPLARGPGDAVRSGSMNLRAPVALRVERASVESTLAEVQRLVDRAATTRPRLLRAADRWAGRFIVAVLALAALTVLAWLFIDPARAPWVAASVLIVTCPCALALAAPAALLAAIGALARRGILVQSMDALEALATADLAVFDKTGTLTTGTPAVALLPDEAGPSGVPALRPAPSAGPPDAAALPDPMAAPDAAALPDPLALAIAAALEARALHPVARALLAEAQRHGAAALPPADALRLLPRGGVQGRVHLPDGVHVARIAPVRQRLELSVHGPRWNAHRTFSLTETVRPDAPAALDALRADGMTLALASGDEPGRVSAAARACGIGTARGGLSPHDKQAWVHDLQHGSPPHRVLMVGDGVNDAPVLRQADVSASVVGAAPLARHQSGVLLLADRLGDLVLARRAARRAVVIVRQGLGLSIAYNVVCVPLAMAGRLSPWLAGVGMAASSLVVVLLALRAGRLGGLEQAGPAARRPGPPVDPQAGPAPRAAMATEPLPSRPGGQAGPAPDRG